MNIFAEYSFMISTAYVTNNNVESALSLRRKLSEHI